MAARIEEGMGASKKPTLSAFSTLPAWKRHLQPMHTVSMRM